MKKRLLLIALVIMLTTTTVMQTEIRAEAAGTVTAVGVAKAVLVLLAIAGVGVTASTFYDDGEIQETAVATFTAWLNSHDPEFYTEFLLAASAITAGRLVNNMNALFYQKLKSNVREYFGTDTSISTSVGTTSFSIDTLAVSSPNSNYYVNITSYPNRITLKNTLSYQVIPVSFYSSKESAYVILFMPTRSTVGLVPSSGGVGIVDSGGTSVNITLNGVSGRWTRFWRYTDTNMTVFKADSLTANSASVQAAYQSILDKYYSGQLASITEDVVLKPFTTVGDVAATSVDATVVGAGQTITEDEEDEIVIDGDRTINLSNVNIDEWLKSLAEGTQTYAEAMEAIGLAAVNTQTQTLEEVQAVVQALNPAAAGTGTITGNYTVQLTDLFPFCIPFDLYNIISCFKADPVAPSAEITIPVGYDGSEFTWETYTLSLSDFDPVAAVVRVLEYIAFVIGLMLVTRKLIEG